MEFSPHFGEVGGAPRTRDLGEVRSSRVQREGFEQFVSVEGLSTFRSQFNVLLLVEGDSEQSRRCCSTCDGVTIFEDGEFEPTVEQRRHFDVVFEEYSISVIRSRVP